MSDAQAAPPTDVDSLSYEDARDELVALVARLESGQASLEESMRLWERGEALASHCEGWLDRAQASLDSSGSADVSDAQTAEDPATPVAQDE